MYAVESMQMRIKAFGVKTLEAPLEPNDGDSALATWNLPPVRAYDLEKYRIPMASAV